VKSFALDRALLRVEWQGDLLTVEAQQAPLTLILREVADKTGLEVRGVEGLQEEVSLRFAGVPLPEGLRRLLARVNYFLAEKPAPQGGTRPALLLVFGRREPPPPVLAGEQGGGSRGMLATEENPEEHLSALYAFAGQGNVEALENATSDPDQVIQATAFELLARQDRQRATARLVEVSKSTPVETRLRSLQLLSSTDYADEETVRSVLGEASADEDPMVRGYATQLLAEQGGTDPLPSLRRALADPDPVVRMQGIESAAQKEEGIPLLQEALADTDEGVRAMAAFWLEQIFSEGEQTSPQ